MGEINPKYAYIPIDKMTKVLLTGGSGFIAAHVLDILLKHGHTVITTVRSQAKADKIKSAHPDAGDKLSFKIVEDIAVEGAFDEAVKIDGLEAVIHTASPFHFNVTDTKKDLLDPAINGTKGVLSLGIEFRGLEESITDLVKSLKDVGA